MELTVLEQKKNRIVFELKGADQTFCHALKDELWNESGVENAGYAIEHPLIGVPRFVVETKEGTSPKDAIASTVKRLKKMNEKFKADAQKEFEE